MDLTIKLENTTLNIRVAILLKSKNGYIFEKHKRGYLFAIGGRVKLNESFIEAAKRELKEELLISDQDFNIKLNAKAIIENFYKSIDENNNEIYIHEICFVYEAVDIYDGIVREEFFVEVSAENFINHDIRPTALLDIMNDKSGEFKLVVVGK